MLLTFLFSKYIKLIIMIKINFSNTKNSVEKQVFTESLDIPGLKDVLINSSYNAIKMDFIQSLEVVVSCDSDSSLYDWIHDDQNEILGINNILDLLCEKYDFLLVNTQPKTDFFHEDEISHDLTPASLNDLPSFYSVCGSISSELFLLSSIEKKLKKGEIENSFFQIKSFS